MGSPGYSDSCGREIHFRKLGNRFRPRWWHTQKHLASMHNQKKDYNQSKDNKGPEVPENQTARNSDNQEVKETFIQTGRSGREGQQGREDSQQGGGWQTRQSHIHAPISQEAQLGSEADCKTQVSVWETKDLKLLAVKSCGGCEVGRNFQSHRRVCWRDPEGPRTYTNSPTQES